MKIFKNKKIYSCWFTLHRVVLSDTLIYLCIDLLIYWFIDSLIHLSILTHWSIDPLSTLLDSLIYWYIDPWSPWLDSLIHWFIDSFINWFINLLIYWSFKYLTWFIDSESPGPYLQGREGGEVRNIFFLKIILNF